LAKDPNLDATRMSVRSTLKSDVNLRQLHAGFLSAHNLQGTIQLSLWQGTSRASWDTGMSQRKHYQRRTSKPSSNSALCVASRAIATAAASWSKLAGSCKSQQASIACNSQPEGECTDYHLGHCNCNTCAGSSVNIKHKKSTALRCFSLAAGRWSLKVVHTVMTRHAGSTNSQPHRLISRERACGAMSDAQHLAVVTTRSRCCPLACW